MSRVPGSSVRGRNPWRTTISVVVGQLALAACSLGQSPTGDTAASPAVTTVIVARDLAFDASTVRLPSGVPVGITLDNRDPGILHNVSISSPQGNVVFRGATFAGIERRTYRLAPLPQGTFRFICDVHPGMAGELLVGTEPEPETLRSSSWLPTRGMDSSERAAS